MKEVPLARWDRQCLADLLALLETTPGSANFRSQLGDPNPHGTAYGGQLLAQTLMAASKSVPGGRSATAMQLFFAQGAIPDQAIYYQTSPLQDGKRFTSRHVRGTQAGGRVVLDAQLSFAVPIESIAHGVSVEPVAALEENPEHLPGFMNLPLAWRDDLQASLSFDFENPALDCRLPDG